MFNTALDFYKKHGLYESNHSYQDRINLLSFFCDKENIGISDIHDYCTMRTLSGVKNSTINRDLTVARAAINYYNKHHDKQILNPFNGFKLFEQDFMPRYLHDFECHKLLKASLDYDNHRLHCFIVLCLNTGCRSGELTKLTWDNVHLDKHYMTVRNNLSKNRKTIHKPLNDKSVQAFTRLKKMSNNSNWVFYSDVTGEHVRSFRRGFESAYKRAGIGKLRIHDLRHTFASFLVQAGVPLYHVMQLLGHSDIRITQRYAHLSPNNLSDVLDKLPDLG